MNLYNRNLWCSAVAEGCWRVAWISREIVQCASYSVETTRRALARGRCNQQHSAHAHWFVSCSYPVFFLIMDHLQLCTSLHLLTLLFYYYCCCCTVCTALLFSYSAIFIAASVRNKLIHSSCWKLLFCEIAAEIVFAPAWISFHLSSD